MESLILDYQNSRIDNAKLTSTFTQLLPEIERIAAAQTTGYSTKYASAHLPFDEELLKKITLAVKEKKTLQPTTLVVIGIGGSNLGTIAVLEAVRGAFYNHHHETKVYF